MTRDQWNENPTDSTQIKKKITMTIKNPNKKNKKQRRDSYWNLILYLSLQSRIERASNRMKRLGSWDRGFVPFPHIIKSQFPTPIKRVDPILYPKQTIILKSLIEIPKTLFTRNPEKKSQNTKIPKYQTPQIPKSQNPFAKYYGKFPKISITYNAKF